MDWKKILAYVGSVLLGLLLVAPVAAQEPTATPTLTPTMTPMPTSTPFFFPGDARSTFNAEPTPLPTLPNAGIWLNSAGVMSVKLGSPLVNQPSFNAGIYPALALPELVLPNINPAEWPSLSMGRQTVLEQVYLQINSTKDTLSNQYGWAREQVANVKETTSALREFIGSPDSVMASGGGRTVTVTGMAQEMSQSVGFSLAYLRAVSDLGPLGLNLVFVFIGLGWMLFVNLMDWLTHIIAWVIKTMFRVIGAVIEFVRILFEIVRTIMALIPFF